MASLFVAVGCWLGLDARAETGWSQCWQHLAPPASRDVGDQRKYAPDRAIDLLHAAIDVTPHFKERSLDAQVTLRFKPIAKPFAELKLDAVDLQVSEVSSTEASRAGRPRWTKSS